MLVYESQADVNLEEKVVIENTREYGGYIYHSFSKIKRDCNCYFLELSVVCSDPLFLGWNPVDRWWSLRRKIRT